MRVAFLSVLIVFMMGCSNTPANNVYDDNTVSDGDISFDGDKIIDEDGRGDDSSRPDNDEMTDETVDETVDETADEATDEDVGAQDFAPVDEDSETADETIDEDVGAQDFAPVDEDSETVDETIDEAVDETPDADIPPPVEICDGIDNNGINGIDEGCNDDGDDYCDINMYTYGLPAICPKGGLDCNDNDPTIYPFSTHFKEGVDYDCDDRIEYMAEVVISVDDTLIDMCVNSEMISPFGGYFGAWNYADTYNVIMESGENVIGIHGRDSGTVISAFIATVKVNGTMIRTDGVMPKLPPPDPIVPYTPSDSQWTATQWRYYPNPASGSPNGGWCDAWFNDSDWGPAIRAGIYGSTPTSSWGHLGASPWTMTCGAEARCPADFRPYYDDATANNEPMWIWDYNPASLADAWFRLKIELP